MNSQPTNRAQEQLKNISEYYRNGRLIDAEKLARSITRENPSNEDAWKALWAILKKNGKTKESLIAIQKAAQISPSDAKVCYCLGYTLLQLGKLGEAEEAFKKAVFLKPDYGKAHYKLGIIFKHLGKLEKAEKSYKKALIFLPNDHLVHYDLGLLLQNLERLDEAEKYYRQAIALNPGFSQAYNNLGIVLKELGKLEEAKKTYVKAIELKPDYGKAHYNLGITLKEQGNLHDAEKSLKKAIRIEPNFYRALFNLGVVQQDLGKLDECLTNFKKVLELKPDSAEAEFKLAALSGETISTVPLDFIELLFDGFANNFENSLVNDLEYKIHNVIAEMLIKKNKNKSLGSILDLGCGTGLFGNEVTKFCHYLVGVDLSSKMLQKAKKKKIYNELVKQDIISYLSNENLDFNYFVCTDVFIYIGDLYEVFKLIKSRNNKGGKLAFSTEHRDGDDYFLEQSGRYSHSKKYIDSLCNTFGYDVSHFEIQNLRKEKNQYIKGGLYILDF